MPRQRDRSSRTPGSLSALRQRNISRVIDALRGGRSLSRAEIARTTGLSRSTVSTLVADLLEEGTLREGAADRPTLGGTGRPGVTVSLNPSAGAAVGIDVAHDGIRVLVADLAGEPMDERWGAAQTWGLDADALMAMVAQTTRDSLAEAGVSPERVVGCVAAVPAPVDPATGLLGAESGIPTLAGRHAAQMLSERLGFSVTVENDANLCAVAEYLWGTAPGHETMVYVKLSRGVGAGLIVDGRMHRGVHGNAGEIGHTSLAPDGPVCRCGNRGCLELLAGTDAVVATATARGEAEDGIEQVIARALADEPAARRAIRDVGGMVGQALGSAVNLLNPSLIVVGGEMAKAWPILEGPLREGMDRSAVHRSAESIGVAPESLGRRAEVLGAVAMVLQHASPLRVGRA